MSIPADATHVVADMYSLRDEQKAMNNKYPYRKKDGDLWLAFVEDEWVNVWLPDPKRYQKIDKPWSGPEDGLPPVGTMCELTEAVLLADEDSADWFEAGTQVDVGGHVMFNGATSSVCAICVVGDNFTGTLSASCLRPIQPALDARESAIRELMDIAQVDCRVTAARLVDAGFKRGVV